MIWQKTSTLPYSKFYNNRTYPPTKSSVSQRCRCGHVTRFWPMVCKLKGYVPSPCPSPLPTWNADMAVARAAILDHRWQLYVEDDRATKQKKPSSLYHETAKSDPVYLNLIILWERNKVLFCLRPLFGPLF